MCRLFHSVTFKIDNMRKTILALFTLISFWGMTQVPRAIVVEHFTNSRCSICANRNPQLFTNLDNNPDVMHIAYHPSSPYSNCIFSQHNASENDLRTNFYGIYGGTPRIVINGVVTNKNFNDATLFDDYQNQTSSFDVRMSHRLTTDSMFVRLVVEAVASGASQFRLTVGIAEDTINYNAPNGENLHQNVFREFTTHNELINAPMMGDSIVLEYAVDRRGAWNQDALYSYALLQDDSNDELLQAGRSAKSSNSIGIGEASTDEFRVYPVPAKDIARFDQFAHYRLIDLTGRVAAEGFSNEINVAELPEGVYLLNINVEGETHTLRLPVVH